MKRRRADRDGSRSSGTTDDSSSAADAAAYDSESSHSSGTTDDSSPAGAAGYYSESSHSGSSVSDDDHAEQSAFLHEAVDNNDIDEARRLIEEEGAHPNTHDGNSIPLITAVLNENPDMVALLLGAGADTRVTASDGEQPLTVAADLQCPIVIMQMLMDAGADITGNDGRMALRHAANDGRINEATQLLLRSGAPIDFYSAISLGLADTVNTYIGTGFDVNAPLEGQSTPLTVAALAGQVAIAQNLVAAGAVLNVSDGSSLLDEATVSGHVAFIQYLKQNGANLHYRKPLDGRTLLHKAAVRGHTELVQFLLTEQIPVNHKDILEGNTALHNVCAYSGDPALVEILASNGASIDIEDNAGNTPLHKAAFCGNVDAMRLLLQRHANPLDVGQDDKTVIDVALEYEANPVGGVGRQAPKTELLSVLLEHCLTHGLVAEVARLEAAGATIAVVPPASPSAAEAGSAFTPALAAAPALSLPVIAGGVGSAFTPVSAVSQAATVGRATTPPATHTPSLK